VTSRRAIVLMNLGGPDSLDAVEPYLYNLFADPAIISLPKPLRLPLARLIARRRAPVARAIYARIGGSSPLLVNTERQARALEAALGAGSRCFIAMRHWHPRTEEALREIETWRPEDIVLLPLYPQFSRTTTGSSLLAWETAARQAGVTCRVRTIRSYPEAPGFIAALAALIGQAFDETTGGGRPPRLLLSAHGLPLRIARAGDPYQGEIERTAAAVAAALDRPGLDWRICYQSRIGPLEWLGPATDEEVRHAGEERVPLIVAPISFVSEHAETLVELDMDYRRLAEESGVPLYRRVPTVGTDPRFIAALAACVEGSG
jgi:ferrochelatase